MFIRTKENTKLKFKLGDSSNLKPEEYVEIGKNQLMQITYYSSAVDLQHIFIQGFYKRERLQGFIYLPHWQTSDLELFEVEEKKTEQPVQTKPNVVSNILWTDFNSPISKYFTVGEALQWDKNRFVDNQKIQSNIIKIATELDKIREYIDSPIGVTSWYRPANINKSVGGVSNSQHLLGNAVDIYPITYSYQKLRAILEDNWYGYLGIYPQKGFFHVDIRNGLGFSLEPISKRKGQRWND